MRAPLTAALVLVAMLVPATAAGGAVDDTSYLTFAAAGVPADGSSGPGVAISASGRYVAFESQADNILPVDTGVTNIFLRDMETGSVSLITRRSNGEPANGNSSSPAISPAGRFVAFESEADNLSDEDNDSVVNVYLHDTLDGSTKLVSRASDGTPADGDSRDPAVSGNAAVIAFESRATNLSADDADTTIDVFTRNTVTDTTTLISRNAAGVGGDSNSVDPSITKDGQRVAFASDADNLFNDDRDRFTNVFMALPQLKLLTHISRTTTSGSQDAPADGNSFEPVISAGGGFVAFTSTAANLGTVTPFTSNVFVRHISGRSTTLISRAGGAGAPGSDSSWAPAISGDGLQVSFVSAADNLSDADNDGVSNVFVRNAYYGTTTLVSRATGAAGAGGDASSYAPALARGADFVAFASDADNLDDGDDDAVTNVFLRQLKFIPTPADIPPDLGSNDHTGPGHGGHTDGTDHSASGHGDTHGAAGHDAAGHGANHFRLVVGSLRADRIFGTATHDKVCGGAGNDTISLSAGSDVGYGGACGSLDPPATDSPAWWRAGGAAVLRHAGDPPATAAAADGNDRLVGGKGEDALFGGAGNDSLVGGSGRDLLSGGAGGDRLVGGPGRNRYYGDTGNDSINSANGVRELVDCGFGRDTVKADPRDRLSGCEKVKRVRRRAKKDLPELLPECPGGGHECHNGQTIVLSKFSR